MPATFRHFAINADDIDRARGFYEKVFQWDFTPWGPPGFLQVKNAGKGVQGALQQRPQGMTNTTFMTTFGVDDIAATLRAIEEHGGKVLMPPFKIEGVGEIAYFEDSEGNKCGVGQYQAGHWE